MVTREQLTPAIERLLTTSGRVIKKLEIRLMVLDAVRSEFLIQHEPEEVHCGAGELEARRMLREGTVIRYYTG